MSNIKMIVSNIEDTMVHREPRIPLYIKHLNKGLKESGVILSYFTGKMPYNFRDFNEDIGLEADVVYAHGGFVKGGEINHAFDASPLRNMVLEALRSGAYVSIQFDDREEELCFSDVEAVCAPDFWKHSAYRIGFENPVPSALLRELVEANASELRNYRVYRNKWATMEITALENNKEVAIRDLAQKYGLTPDEVLVIGASEHDVPVFEWAKHSVAVGNAHYKLKAKAGYVADRDYDAGYVEAIKLYFPEIARAAKVDSNRVADWYE